MRTHSASPPRRPRPAGAIAPELVVLLDEHGAPVGTAPKETVHHADTPLHRAFSCYAFRPDGRLLLTRRASSKRTFPGLWTNTVCGHPAPGESDQAALSRRADYELGLSVRDVQPALPRFRYRAESGGLVENEICPVYLATVDDQPQPDATEVQEVRWSTWQEFWFHLTTEPRLYSPWCQLQARELEVDQAVPRFLSRRA